MIDEDWNEPILPTEKKPAASLVSVVASHPLVAALIGVVGTIAGSILTVLLSPDSVALTAANQRITVLEQRLEKSQAEKDALAKSLQDAEETLKAATNPKPFDSSNEQFTVPVGEFMGIMHNSYLAYVKSIKNNVATVTLKNMEGVDSEVFLSKGSQIVRTRNNFECLLSVLDVTDNSITMKTVCRGVGQ